jgi:anti-repressor protein
MQRSRKDKKSEKYSNATLTSDSRNELIPIITQENEQMVDARQLHSFLQVKSSFNDWFKNRVRDFGFTENLDFTSSKILVKLQGRPEVQYQLTLDMAKELAMIERNEKGRQIRRYFIQKEKELQGLKRLGFINTATDLFKGMKPMSVNHRKLWAWKDVKVRLGYAKTTQGTGYMYRYPNHFVTVGDLTYISDEMARHLAAYRAVQENRKVVKNMAPVLLLDFNQNRAI